MTEKYSMENSEIEKDSEELRFARTQSYFDRSKVIRILIITLFSFALFLFLHFRQTYVEPLELGSQAKHYVVSQVDFTFPDDEATIILRQEAAHSIGSIYRIQENNIKEQLAEFQKQIRESGEVEEFGTALNIFSEILYRSRFVDALTWQRIEQLPPELLPAEKKYFFVLYVTEEQTNELPKSFWHFVGKQLAGHDSLREEYPSLFRKFFQRVGWHFAQDEGMEYSLRKAVMEQIPERYTPIRSSERIIDQGERVTGRHLVMMQAMKEALDHNRNMLDPMALAGSVLLTLLFVLVAAIYVRENHKDIVLSNRRFALLCTIVILTLYLAKMIELLFIHERFGVLDLVRFPLFAPFAAILISTLLNARIASFAAIFTTIVLTLALAVESTPFLVINILTALVALLSAQAVRRRTEIFSIAARAWIASIVVILAVNLYEGTPLSFSFFLDLTSAFLFMLFTAVAIVGLLPILESLFKILTNITLMEFLDPSNELLRRLTIEAPGTYQHSIVVGNLAEAAASAIGANGLFCRVATYYHDIGKLANPQYFTENQLGGVDMHQLLTPLESAQVIIAHVSEGVLLARKFGLPEQFIDIIKEHHGTTLVYYFYHKQLELNKEGVNKLDFRYSGPRPRTKESTLIMLADTLEAASRSLDVLTETTITELVDALVFQKMEDHQFDDSLLTFEELGIIKKVIVKTLLAASHLRVKYPPHHPGEEG